MSRIYRFISLLLLSSIAVAAAHAQQPVIAAAQAADSIAAQAKAQDEKKTSFIQGAGVIVDLCGLAMKGLGSDFANMEVAARLNFKEKYFPIFELGLGDSRREGMENNNSFSTTAPYFRVGMDYNFNKKQNGNRFFGGLRYGFSSFKYNFHNPDFRDEVWGTLMPLHLTDAKGKKQWLEVVMGVETKLWSIIRLGYSVRYKIALSESAHPSGKPWFVPGFGRNDSSAWGGTVNLTFDVGKSAKAQKKAGLLDKL